MLKIRNQKKDPMVPGISLSTLLDISSFGHLDEVVANQKDVDFTRRDLKRDRLILAKALLQIGVKRGDVVIVANARSLYDNIVIFFALNRIGAIACFFDEKMPRDMILNRVEHFKPKALFAYHWKEKRIASLKADAKNLPNIINITSDFNQKNWQSSVIETMMLGKHSLMREAEKYRGRVPRTLFHANDETLITFTSGSTSGPKPVVFTNKAIIADAIYSKTAAGVKMWDKNLHSWMATVKFSVPYGLIVSTLAPILGGGKMILTPDLYPELNPNYEEALNYYINKGPNTVFATPPLLEMLTRLKEETDVSQVKMITSGGERLEKEQSLKMLDFFKSRGTKIKISNGYGVGEALGLISTAVGGVAYNPDTVGRIPAGVHVMVVHPETWEELGFNKVGIILVSGKHILNRYYNRPDLDEEKIVKIGGRRFVNTGDLGYVTETGYISLVGRATFFLNNIPTKIYYELVRSAVARSELVKKSYVVKGPNERYGLAAYAFVVVKDGVAKNNETRRAIVKKATETFNLGKIRVTLKPFEIPAKVIFLDDLPMTEVGKTDFRRLERMAVEIHEEEEKKKALVREKRVKKVERGAMEAGVVVMQTGLGLTENSK